MASDRLTRRGVCKKGPGQWGGQGQFGKSLHLDFFFEGFPYVKTKSHIRETPILWTNAMHQYHKDISDCYLFLKLFFGWSTIFFASGGGRVQIYIYTYTYTQGSLFFNWSPPQLRWRVRTDRQTNKQTNKPKDILTWQLYDRIDRGPIQ